MLHLHKLKNTQLKTKSTRGKTLTVKLLSRGFFNLILPTNYFMLTLIMMRPYLNVGNFKSWNVQLTWDFASPVTSVRFNNTSICADAFSADRSLLHLHRQGEINDRMNFKEAENVNGWNIIIINVTVILTSGSNTESGSECRVTFTNKAIGYWQTVGQI